MFGYFKKSPENNVRFGVSRTLGIFVIGAAVMLFPATRASAIGLGAKSYVSFSAKDGAVALVRNGKAAELCLDSHDYVGVLLATKSLCDDIKRVSSVRPEIVNTEPDARPDSVLIGTIGHSSLIDGLVKSGKLNIDAIRGRWESYVTQVVDHPLPGIDRALVIAGSDKRGTIYGIYDVSEQIGVSPWYWWADVPVPHHDNIFILPGRHVTGAPAVKYRGIFLNDEAPALSGWVHKKFGGFNHKFYEKVFELLLRLKANYLWPAMWSNAFNEDDPMDPRLANEYGIVMGTSHHEPMLRSQQEWIRHGVGPWNYATNGAELRKFWTEGIRRNKNYESIVTLGMRGNGDKPMSAKANTALLERIVADQRKILAKNMNPDLSKIPQVWALYKEVQTYYEKGMRVPDDVTLLWCDDNWGNIRRLPTAAERKRSGGAGVYYHFDYVGGPRDYKWLNTVPITKVWEQMHLAWKYGANRIWIVNVGDLKPLEFPIEFFLRMARHPDRWNADNLDEYTRLWAARQFGPDHAKEIASLISAYTKFNGRRKPELLSPTTYSLVNYHESERMTSAYSDLARKANALAAELPEDARSAFYELVQYPIDTCANLNELYRTVGLNRLYARQGRVETNHMAAKARALFRKDAGLTDEYNHDLAGGKWDHFMDQTHIGYTWWQEPVLNAMPGVQYVQPRDSGSMGIAVEGDEDAWPGYTPDWGARPKLPPQNPYDRESRYIDVFNRGRTPFTFTTKISESWIHISPAKGTVRDQTRLDVSVDWTKAPAGSTDGTVTVSGSDGTVETIAVPLDNPKSLPRDAVKGFVETDGYVSMEAAHYSKAVGSGDIHWKVLPDFGRTLSAVTMFPVTAPSQTAGGDDPHLEYDFHVFKAGDLKVHLYFAPTLAFQPGRGLRCAVSIDDGKPQILDISTKVNSREWEKAVSDSAREMVVSLPVSDAGDHVLKFWMVDPAVVLEKIVIDAGGLRPSYLGPGESYHRSVN